MNNYWKQKSARLRAFREDRRFSREQIAQKLGVNQKTYINYETGVSEPPFEVLNGLARLGLDLHTLITGDEKMLDKEIQAYKDNVIKLEGQVELLKSLLDDKHKK